MPRAWRAGRRVGVGRVWCVGSVSVLVVVGGCVVGVLVGGGEEGEGEAKRRKVDFMAFSVAAERLWERARGEGFWVVGCVVVGGRGLRVRGWEEGGG